MHFMKAIAVVVSGVFPSPVTYCLMLVPPLLQTGIDIVLVGIHTGSWGNRGADQGLDRHLLYVFTHPNHHRTTALDHSADRRCLTRKYAAPPLALTCRLGVVAPLFGDLGALTAWTADAVWPAQGTDSRKAFRVVDEGLDVYHGASIAYHAMRDKSNVKEDTP